MDGRAAPMKSVMPRLIWLAIVSGDVKRPTVTTGVVGHGFDPDHVGLQRALLGEARHAHLQRIIGDVDVPEVRQMGEHLEHVAAFAKDGRAARAGLRVGGEAREEVVG